MFHPVGSIGPFRVGPNTETVECGVLSRPILQALHLRICPIGPCTFIRTCGLMAWVGRIIYPVEIGDKYGAVNMEFPVDLTLGAVSDILCARFSGWECPNGVIKKEKVKNGY